MDDRFDDWRRWLASDEEGRDEDADLAFGALFRRVPTRLPDPAFAERVAQATARAAARQARIARAVLICGAVCGLGLAVAVLFEIPRLLQASLDLVIGAIVSTTLALGRGVGAWTVLAQLARALGGVVVTPQGTFALSGLGLVAIGALYALHRVLEVEERSSI
jgi:hypothetical protein